MKKAKLKLGKTVATRGAIESVSDEDMAKALTRHEAGDWGIIGEEDQKENELSLEKGFRILSVYRSSAGTLFWVITEADRSQTTVLLPEDY